MKRQFKEKDLLAKIDLAWELASACRLCPRECGVNRIQGETGFCKIRDAAPLAHSGIHWGEEPVLSGCGGAGAIFFAGCNLHCVYCQNYQISQSPEGYPLFSGERLAEELLRLQGLGAQNIDFVSPTHVAPVMMEAVFLARKQGLKLPIVYNTNAYDSLKLLRLLEGFVDVYLPDLKYFGNKEGAMFSGVPDYADRAREAVKLMYAQAGGLVLDRKKRARSGVIIRHLVLPDDVAGTAEVLDFVRDELPKAGLSLMSQYSPCYNAGQYHRLARPLSAGEYDRAVDRCLAVDRRFCWMQEMNSNEIYIPDFSAEQVFGPKESQRRRQ